MHLLFDVLTDFTAYLKEDVISPIVESVMSKITLKTKFSAEELKSEVYDKIYTEINEVLFDQFLDEKSEKLSESDDTDFDSDDSCRNVLNPQKLEVIKEHRLKAYRSNIMAQLVQRFDLIDLDKYTKGIESDLEELKDSIQEEQGETKSPNDEFEQQDPIELLKNTVLESTKDYLESSYSQSIFIDSVD